MERKVIVGVCIGLVIVAIPVGGWLWLGRVMEDMMFVPNQHSTDRLRTDLEPLFGEPILNATVVRVDHDTNLLFFIFDASQKEIESSKAAFIEQGWSISSSTSDTKQTLSATFDLGERRVRLIRLEALDDDSYYGGYQFAGIDINFNTRYEENRVCAQQERATRN